MKALTLTQPWASLVAAGFKQVETRSWNTQWRGEIAFHAAKGFPRTAKSFAEEERLMGRVRGLLPLGAVVAVGHVAYTERTERAQVSDLERRLGDYAPGRWAWRLADVRALATPVPCRGALSLWELPADALEAVVRQLSEATA